MRATSACAAWEAPGTALPADGGAMPGTMFSTCWPGFMPIALAWVASSSRRSLRFCCFFVTPVHTSQPPPLPSSMTQLGGNSELSLTGSGSSSFFGAALALEVAFGAAFAALTFGCAFAAAFVSAFAFAFALGSAFGWALGSALGSALAFAFALAFASAFGSAAGGFSGSALALALALAFG